MSTSRRATQASGLRADVVLGAIEACRLEAREPARVRLGGGSDAVRAEKEAIGRVGRVIEPTRQAFQSLDQPDHRRGIPVTVVEQVWPDSVCSARRITSFP